MRGGGNDLRTTFAAKIRTPGADNPQAFATESLLVSVLPSLGAFVEAEVMCRGALEMMQRTLGREHNDTLVTSANLATSLSEQGKYAGATEIGREVIVSRTHVPDAEHEGALVPASNLVVLLSQCGQKMEAGQLFRQTLALARRALGPTHKLTLNLLRHIHARSVSRCDWRPEWATRIGDLYVSNVHRALKPCSQ